MVYRGSASDGRGIGVPQRPRHPVKELEAVLRHAERLGWRVTKRKKYYKLYCPCEDKHRLTLHLTPSGGRYEMNWRKHATARTCWAEEDGS